MKKLIALALAVVLLSSFAAARHTVAAVQHKSYYPLSARVVEIDRTADLVTVETAVGMLYEFYGTEDYCTGDLISLLMHDNSTPDDVTDDMILDARFSGYSFD